MNKCIFTGRLTRDPELKHTTSGTAVLSASIAVDDGWGDRKRTFFPNLVFWRHSAEYLSRFARKGDMLEVSARYTERTYQDRDGNNRTVKEFEADEVKIISSSRRGGAQEAAQRDKIPGGDQGEYPQNGAAYEDEEADEGELPF